MGNVPGGDPLPANLQLLERTLERVRDATRVFLRCFSASSNLMVHYRHTGLSADCAAGAVPFSIIRADDTDDYESLTGSSSSSISR